MADFDVNAALKAYLDDPQSILTPEADPALLDCENDPEAFTPGLVNSVLNPTADAVGESPETLVQASHLDSLQFLLKCAPSIRVDQRSDTHLDGSGADCELFARCRQTSYLPAISIGKLLDVVISGLGAETEIILHEEQEGDVETAQHKQTLEVFAFPATMVYCCCGDEER